MNLIDIMQKTKAQAKEEKKMTKDLAQALINHLNADADKISNTKLPIGDVDTINSLLEVMEDIKAVANTLRQEIQEPPKMEIVPVEPQEAPQEAKPTEETEEKTNGAN